MLKKNPLQTLTVGIAVVGVIFSIFNFYLLANISPLERRVDAIEERNEKMDLLANEFIEMKGTFRAMQNDLTKINEKLDFIINLHVK